MTRAIPSGRPRPNRRPRKDWLIVAVLAGLAALVAVLWFADPAHRWYGSSRVDWPAPSAAKP